MSIGTAVFLAMIVLALLYGVVTYNGLVQLKHNIAKAWANIDVLLKQRHDELPKLVEVCRQYKQFEQETLQRVIEARSQVQSARETQNIGALGEAEGVPKDWILCGNGAADLIFRLALAKRPRHALVLAPTFAEYEAALETVGCDVRRCALDDLYVNARKVGAIGSDRLSAIDWKE